MGGWISEGEAEKEWHRVAWKCARAQVLNELSENALIEDRSA